MSCERVSKRNSQVARNRALKIIKKIRESLTDKYKFEHRLVGSATRNTIIKDINNRYDLDYQLRLTKNSKEYKNNNFSSPTNIKNDFFNAINSNKNEDERVENSTTAITVRKYKNSNCHEEDEIFSIDYVIISVVPDNDKIIRRNNKKESQNINEFTWNKLPDVNKAFQKFSDMNWEDKRNVCDDHIIPRKCKEKMKVESDESIVSSSRIFIEEVNNYDK